MRGVFKPPLSEFGKSGRWKFTRQVAIWNYKSRATIFEKSFFDPWNSFLNGFLIYFPKIISRPKPIMVGAFNSVVLISLLESFSQSLPKANQSELFGDQSNYLIAIITIGENGVPADTLINPKFMFNKFRVILYLFRVIRTMP